MTVYKRLLAATFCDVVASGNYAYLADSSNGLRVVNIADPANPQQVGHFDPTGSTAGHGVYYAEPYVYLADGLGLLILDVSDPTAPAEMGRHKPTGFTVKVQVSGQYAYAANREGGLSIADVSDAAAPQPISNYFDAGSAPACPMSLYPALMFMPSWQGWA